MYGKRVKLKQKTPDVHNKSRKQHGVGEVNAMRRAQVGHGGKDIEDDDQASVK